MTNKTFMSMVSDYGANPTQEGFDAIYVRYLADCRAASSPAGVVKPLEWRDESIGVYRRDRAVTSIGTYSEWRDGSLYYNEVRIKICSDFEAAKSAAFEDYSARIMSAIEPDGVGVETPPPSSHVAGPSVDDIAEVLFSQRGTPYRWERAIDADPLSDEGTLVSIVRDDARAVLSLFATTEGQDNG